MMDSQSWVWGRLRTLVCECGQDMTEYAMLIAFVAIVAVVAITAVGQVINETFYAEFANRLLEALG